MAYLLHVGVLRSADSCFTVWCIAAEITELIHVASLLHDDVLDNADTRRGLRALNTLFGNKVGGWVRWGIEGCGCGRLVRVCPLVVRCGAMLGVLNRCHSRG